VRVEEEEGEEGGGLAGGEGMRQKLPVPPDLKSPQEADGKGRVIWTARFG
jgi:hypothetical protein